MIKRKQIVIKKENQIWYKNKLKSNVKGWIWKQNSINIQNSRPWSWAQD